MYPIRLQVTIARFHSTNEHNNSTNSAWKVFLWGESCKLLESLYARPTHHVVSSTLCDWIESSSSSSGTEKPHGNIRTIGVMVSQKGASFCNHRYILISLHNIIYYIGMHV